MQQIIKPIINAFKKTITLPGSKSITNRALLLAALAEGESHLSGVLVSDDTRAFLVALKTLGIEIELDRENSTCLVKGNNGIFHEKIASVWCQDAGTVARFLLAACAASPGEFFFDATPRLRQRPIGTLLKTLCAQGMRVEPVHATNMPFTISGTQGLQGGTIEIDGSESGQFISALLMIAPFSQTDVTLKTFNLVSKPYVKMTCQMMREFGVKVHKNSSEEFFISVPQKYQAQNYFIEPDLSTASYFFAAAAITQSEITITDIQKKHCKQGDIQFLNVLEQMGCEITETTTESISVRGTKTLRGVDVDMKHFSDTFMTLATIAPFADTPTTITGIGHTREQESDRINATENELKKLGIRVESGQDWLRIFPGEPKAGIIDSHHDHRIAMAFALIGLRTPEIIIDDAECVAKTCPEFFEILLSM